MGGAVGWDAVCVCVCVFGGVVVVVEGGEEVEGGGAADLRALVNTKGPGPPPHLPHTMPRP